MISMLNAIVDSDSDRPTWFIHGSRNSREHAMGTHVRQVARENSNLQVHVRYSQPLPKDTEGSDYDDQGYVDIELLAGLLPDNGFDFFLCGPTPFMKSLFGGLLDWGVPESRIHYEFFGPASALQEKAQVIPEKSAAEVVQTSGEVEVTFSKSAVTATWDSSLRSILDLAEAQGLSPAYSCRSGICNTCICRLEEGEVEYFVEPLETPGQGWALICCSKPKTDVVVAV
jgi:ferredoxin-NADP reductase